MPNPNRVVVTLLSILNSMKRTLRSCLLAAVIAPSGLLAQTVTPESAVSADAESELPYGITAELTTSLDSRYVFRGATLGKEYLWSQAEISLPLTDRLSFDFTPYFGGTLDGRYRELNVIGVLSYGGEGYTMGAGFYWYHYPKGYFLDNQYELNLSFSKEIGPVELSFLYAYEFEIEGHYTELSLSHERELSENLGLSLTAAVAGNRNYNSDGSSFDHAFFNLGVPITICKNGTLTPYVALNWAFDGLQDAGEPETTLFGGVSLSWSF